MRKCRKETAVIEVINKADAGFLNSASALSIILETLKNLFAMVHQRFNVFFWCGDRCDTIILHKKVQNIRRQECRKRRAKTDIFDTQVQEG